MIRIERPGAEPLEIECLLIDFEGALAMDRRVHPKAKDKINLLSKRLKIFIFITGRTEKTDEMLRKVKAEVVSVEEGRASQEKLGLLNRVGRGHAVVVGNGADDVPALQGAALGICVLGKEGAAAAALATADLVVTDVLHALDFLLKPLRQRATLTR